MTVPQRNVIAQIMQQKTTEELLEILLENDKEQWTDAAFESVRSTLRERGVESVSQTLSEGTRLRQERVTNHAIVDPLPRYKGVRGWLLVFCIGLTVLNPLVIIASLGATTTSDMFHDFRPAFIANELLSFVFAAILIYVGVSLWRVRPGAVKKAKVLLWCIVALNAIVVVLSTFTASSLSPDHRANGIANAIAAFVWLAYLDSSKRVKATYGGEPSAP